MKIQGRGRVGRAELEQTEIREIEILNDDGEARWCVRLEGGSLVVTCKDDSGDAIMVRPICGNQIHVVREVGLLEQVL